MSSSMPYTYIQCPCSDPSTLSRSADQSSPTELDADGDDDRTFDPRAPRSNYSLYPLEYLLYCEDCHQIRCQRCVAEEIVTYYCPNCLFEVPTGNIKSEGNRSVVSNTVPPPLAMGQRSCLLTRSAPTYTGVPAAASNALYASALSP